MNKPVWLRDSYSLRTHLIVFGLAILLPVTVLAGLLLARSAALERTQLKARLIQVADDLAAEIDREIDRHFTVRTLARLPALAAADWRMFYEQAKGAVEGRGYVIVIDSSLKQLVNTLLPYGSAPAMTGDPDTAPSHAGQQGTHQLRICIHLTLSRFATPLSLLRTQVTSHDGT